MTDYSKATGHPADFEVHYRFYTVEEGGRRKGPPFQGYRCDWAYEGDDIGKTGIYMIGPEFMDANGVDIPEGIPVSVTGIARMWIVSDELRVSIHRNRIREGVKGYFMEGNHRVAEAVVTRLIGIATNGEAGRSPGNCTAPRIAG